ncbi:MAG: DUF2182 domain-containing protein [Nitrosopumilus sp.]|nr:DUF2182 domain-containing protein [Nitrosopumilus sp.]
MQPDMMIVMMTYSPLLIALFIASWTAGMAAMMFPAIVPMLLLYNKIIMNKQIGLSTEITEKKITHIFRNVLFVGIYLVIWALTGVGLLFIWSVPMNSFITLQDSNNIGIIFGSVLIVSGAYQFSSLKNKCIGYCESPLSFFMKRWDNGKDGAIKMGTYHGFYCLGCCWPYFLIMMALGWMNLMWMGLFALIIFGEKIWSRGIWIARIVGIIFIIIGTSSILGVIILYKTSMVMNTPINVGEKIIMSHDNKIISDINQGKLEAENRSILQQGMNM